jgi:rRNA-processing protein FCF1
MDAILDTNFMIYCLKNKIDFFDQLEERGFKIIIPKEVLEEMKDLKKDASRVDRTAVEVLEDLFSKRKFKKISLGGRSVDAGLIEMGKRGNYIASMDAAVRRSVPNRIIINTNSKSVEIDRA